MKSTLFVLLQYIAPQQLLSRTAGWFANTRIEWIKKTFIRWFIKRYRVDMSIAADPDPNSYPNFNAFFTRPLATGQRPVSENNSHIVCPADGAISQINTIEGGRIFQAKGHDFTLEELLGGVSRLAKPFYNGLFTTIYLSPKDYHRVHMPYTGTLNTMIHIPGKLFSVNTTTTATVPCLFARNERVAALFNTDIGPMAVIMVGAMIVAGINTVWTGQITPVKNRIRTVHYSNNPSAITLKKGEEMGHFTLGSTVILLFPKDSMAWRQSLAAQSPVVMGQHLGTVNKLNKPNNGAIDNERK